MGKKIRQRSITFRMSVNLALLIAFLMAALGFGNYYSAREAFQKEALDKGRILVQSGSAMAVAHLYAGSPELLRDLLYKVRANGDVSYAAVIAGAGRIVAHTDQSQVGGTLSLSGGFPTREVVTRYKDPNGSNSGYDFISPVTLTMGGTPAGYFRLGLDTARYDNLLREIVLNTLIMSLVAILAGILLARVMATRLLKRPVVDLMAATEHIAAGDFAHRVPVHSKDELGSLAAAFNTMTGQLANLFLSVRTSAAELSRSSQVILNRSQVFRLAAENTPIEEAGAPPATPDSHSINTKKQREALDEITQSAKKMSRLVDRLNALSLQFKV